MEDLIKILSIIGKPPFLFIITDSEGKITYSQNTLLDTTTLVPMPDGTLYDKKNDRWYQYNDVAYGEYRIMCFSDVTNLERKINEDTLTKVYSRDAIFEKLAQNIIDINQNNGTFSIAMCDIDGFKGINDQYGHDAGDEALRAFCKELLANADQDTVSVGRRSGDEFLIIYDNTSFNEAAAKVERLRKDIAGLTITTPNAQFPIGASFGVYQYFPSNLDIRNPQAVKDEVRNILDYVDKQMYESKKASKADNSKTY